MVTFLGEFHCSVDEKGRIKMPVDLRKQFPAEDKGRFMLAKGLEDCLMIYPLETWKGHEEKLRKLNRFNKAHRDFISAFTVGLTQIELDGNDRFLIPKQVMKYINGAKEVILKADLDQIQIWEAGRYEQYTQGTIANVQSLSEEVAKYLDQVDESK